MPAVFTTDLEVAAIGAAHGNRCHCGAVWEVPIVLPPPDDTADPVMVLVCCSCCENNRWRSLDVTI